MTLFTFSHNDSPVSIEFDASQNKLHSLNDVLSGILVDLLDWNYTILKWDIDSKRIYISVTSDKWVTQVIKHYGYNWVEGKSVDGYIRTDFK